MTGRKSLSPDVTLIWALKNEYEYEHDLPGRQNHKNKECEGVKLHAVLVFVLLFMWKNVHGWFSQESNTLKDTCASTWHVHGHFWNQDNASVTLVLQAPKGIDRSSIRGWAACELAFKSRFAPESPSTWVSFV